MADDRGGRGWRNQTDDQVLAGITSANADAVSECYQRFVPRLVRIAGLLGAPLPDAEELADDVLERALLLFVTDAKHRPRNLRGYLEAALRNRVKNWLRSEERRARVVAEDVVDPDRAHPDAGVIASEGSLRASNGAPPEHPAMLLSVRRLASAIDEGLTDEERLILEWVSNMVPQREIARWLGTGHEATGRRIRRLTERLLEVAERYALTLSDSDWRELEPFFRRAAVGDQSSRAVGWHQRVRAAREEQRRRRESI